MPMLCITCEADADVGNEIWRKEQTCVDGIQWRSCGSVPESDALVSSATARSNQPMLVGRPGQGFDCGLVIRESDHWGGVVQPPDVELIVVAARGQLSIIRRPLQSADLHIAYLWSMHLLLEVLGSGPYFRGASIIYHHSSISMKDYTDI